jgi:hypothetical protein
MSRNRGTVLLSSYAYYMILFEKASHECFMPEKQNKEGCE